MRQQLRLKILVPVAVLGLLGAGVGAFAGGSPPNPLVVPPPTTGATTTGESATPKRVRLAVWSKQANAVCRDITKEFDRLAPRTLTDADAMAAGLVRVLDDGTARLAALGLPRRHERDAKVVLRGFERATEVARDFEMAVQHADRDAFRSAVRRLDEIDSGLNGAARRLGADACLDAPERQADEPSERELANVLRGHPENALKLVLLYKPVVVVVFYQPRSPVDGAAIYAARAAARDMGAAFLPLDAGRNAIAKLAAKYGVRSSPAVLVITRGLRIKAQFDRYADEETIAQAVENARR